MLATGDFDAANLSFSNMKFVLICFFCLSLSYFRRLELIYTISGAQD